MEEEKVEARRPAEDTAGPKRTNDPARKQAAAAPSGARNPPQNSRK